jgi:hypothetical protein
VVVVMVVVVVLVVMVVVLVVMMMRRRRMMMIIDGDCDDEEEEKMPALRNGVAHSHPPTPHGPCAEGGRTADVAPSCNNTRALGQVTSLVVER